MTTTPTEPQPKPTEPTTTPDPTQGNPDDSALGDAGKKALDVMKSERNAAKQQAADLQKQLDAINQANESAVEKAQRELKEARDAASKATQDALRFRIAAETGITENADLILTGSDEATMRRQAELWSGRPAPAMQPDPSQGNRGGQSPTGGTPEADWAQFLQNATGQ